jgi:hypothetical protein
VLGNADPNSRRNPAALCWLCLFKAGGLSIQAVEGVRLHGPTPRHPEFLACSIECQEALLSLVTRGKGRVDVAILTDMEKQAAIAARLTFYNAACEAGLKDAVEALDETQIDKLIWAAVDGFRASMRQQSMLGEIPI